MSSRRTPAPRPMQAHAICDGDTIMEVSSTGHLCIYYELQDAVWALPSVQRGCHHQQAKRLKIVPVNVRARKLK